MEPNTQYEKALFQRKLVELGFANGFVEQVMALLDDEFSFDQLQSGGEHASAGSNRLRVSEFDAVANAILALAKSNYEFTFSPEQSLAGTGHLSVFAVANQRHRGLAVRAVSTTTTARCATMRRIPRSTAA